MFAARADWPEGKAEIGGVTHGRKKTRPFLIGFFSTTNNKPDNNLLSHWLQHYHRRKVVSR
ncbi:hypothetical protein, partial [Janthinobacterium aquaticum]|uniref:hypothetical protein n=1 Tax=Janthinobacterium sp. FT58W TaxID=2654254 RepID=UPI001D01CD52